MNSGQLTPGVCSWSLQVSSVPELEQFAQRLGVSVVQIACGDPHHATWIEGDAMPAAVRAAQLRPCGAMLGFPGEDYTTPRTIRDTGGFGPEPLRPERLERVRWGLKRTRELGLDWMSTHAGFIPPPGDPSRPEYLRTLAQVAALADEASVDIAFETGQETADVLKLTLDELKCPRLKVNFDPANMILYDMGEPLRAVEILAPYVRHVHAKDATRTTVPGEWGREVPLGEGQVNIPAFVQKLWDVGYRGPVCVEREAGSQAERFADIVRGIDVLRSAIGRVTGA